MSLQPPQELTLDIVSRLTFYAASAPHESLLSHLATSFGYSFPECRIDVIWAPSRSRKEEAGETWCLEEPATRAMAKEAIHRVQEARKSLEYRDVDLTLDYWVLQRNPWILMLRRTSQKVTGGGTPACQRREGELWVSFECPESDGGADKVRELLLEFTQYVQGMKLIYATFEALSPVSNLRRLSGEVLNFSTNVQDVPVDRPRRAQGKREPGAQARRPPDFQEAIADRTRGAHGLLHRVIRTSSPASDIGFRHIRELSLSVMQGLFGSPLVTGSRTLNSVRRFSGRLLKAAAQFGGAQRRAIERAAVVLAAATGKPDACDVTRTGESVDELGEELMARWSWCYFVAGTTALQGGDPPSLDDDRWLELARCTVSDLTRCLLWWSVAEANRSAERGAGDDDPASIGRLDTAHIPPWLSLWFCQQLLHAEIGEAEKGPQAAEEEERRARRAPRDSGQAGQAPPSIQALKRPWPFAGKWRFRADLAYVLRESIRVFLFGRRADYRFQPAMLAKALRTLIEYHVLRIVGLPGKLDICGLLEIIGQGRPFEADDIAAGHLQHIFEVYIAGHFLCSVTLEGRQDRENLPAPRRLLGLLAGQGRGDAQKLRSADFLKAFSLAALVHTAGRLLFPRWSREIEVFGQLDRGLRDQLRQVQLRLNSSATDLAEACGKELISAGYLTARTDPDAIQWIDDKKELGEPDTGLLSAWFCHRIGLGVEGLEENVLRQAVRAVLFVRAGTQPIRPETDPVSVLLLLCDEMFAWSPAAGGASAPAGGRRTIAVLSAASPRNYRFRSIRIDNLRFRVQGDEAGRLHFIAGISTQDQEADGGFPRFEIELSDPAGTETTFPFMVWLELAQSFGRVQAAGRRGAEDGEASFRPVVVLRARRSSELEDAGLTCKDLLEELSHQAALSLRPSLRRWLETAEIFGGETPGELVEAIEIRPQGRPLHSQDLSPFLPELDRLAKLIVKTRQADRRAARLVEREPRDKRGSPR